MIGLVYQPRYTLFTTKWYSSSYNSRTAHHFMTPHTATDLDDRLFTRPDTSIATSSMHDTRTTTYNSCTREHRFAQPCTTIASRTVTYAWLLLCRSPFALPCTDHHITILATPPKGHPCMTRHSLQHPHSLYHHKQPSSHSHHQWQTNGVGQRHHLIQTTHPPHDTNCSVASFFIFNSEINEVIRLAAIYLFNGLNGNRKKRTN